MIWTQLKTDDSIAVWTGGSLELFCRWNDVSGHRSDHSKCRQRRRSWFPSSSHRSCGCWVLQSASWSNLRLNHPSIRRRLRYPGRSCQSRYACWRLGLICFGIGRLWRHLRRQNGWRSSGHHPHWNKEKYKQKHWCINVSIPISEVNSLGTPNGLLIMQNKH